MGIIKTFGTSTLSLSQLVNVPYQEKRKVVDFVDCIRLMHMSPSAGIIFLDVDESEIVLQQSLVN